MKDKKNVKGDLGQKRAEEGKKAGLNKLKGGKTPKNPFKSYTYSGK